MVIVCVGMAIETNLVRLVWVGRAVVNEAYQELLSSP